MVVVEEQSRIKERWDEKERVNGVRLKGETEIMAGRASLRQPSEKKGQREKKKQTPPQNARERSRYRFVIEGKATLVRRNPGTENHRRNGRIPQQVLAHHRPRQPGDASTLCYIRVIPRSMALHLC